MILSKLKNYVLLALLVITVGLVITVAIYNNITKKQKTEFEIAMNNYKALQSENQMLFGKNRIYKLTIDDLNSMTDSISMVLKSTQKELKIKNRQLVSMQYILDEFKKKDTIRFTDTIFIPELNIDTTLFHPYYQLNLHLEYPNIIFVEPIINNEKIVFVSNKRETIDPPKKWWIQRIFQKKHTVATVDVEDKNPYMITKKQRFIQIVE